MNSFAKIPCRYHYVSFLPKWKSSYKKEKLQISTRKNNRSWCVSRHNDASTNRATPSPRSDEPAASHWPWRAPPVPPRRRAPPRAAPPSARAARAAPASAWRAARAASAPARAPTRGCSRAACAAACPSCWLRHAPTRDKRQASATCNRPAGRRESTS